MTSPADTMPPHDGPLEEAIAEYLEAVETGRPLDRDEWLARHPDLADDLRAFLADREGFLRAADVLAAPAAPAPLGTVRYFGDYELLGEIGRGAMGVVYRARQISLNRVVALKMILSGRLASAADVRRFQTEAEAAGNLDHPNVVPIYEVGEHQGQHYFSMKLIDGGLDQQVGAFGQDPKAAARLIGTVARAVHHAHQRGVLHRDLKPANILLDQDGQPHVTDFGLAKHLTGGAGSTQSGAIVGTPAYMPPEQARAEKVLTTASDVYALGAILYELLTGQPPFRAATLLDTLLQVREQEPTPPAELNPKADPDLAAVALKCLEKDPNRRYPSAAALADELESWLRGEGVQARPLGRLRRRLRWTRQHLTINALLVVGLVVPLVYIWIGSGLGALSARAAAELTGVMALLMLSLLYALPARLSAWLAREERRAAPPEPPPQPGTVLVLDVTARRLRRSALTAVARGAWEGLLVSCLLLVIHSQALGMRLGSWPDPGLGWFCTFFCQAALMMALARVLACLIGGLTDSPPDRKTGTLPDRLFTLLLGGWPWPMFLSTFILLPDVSLLLSGGQPGALVWVDRLLLTWTSQLVVAGIYLCVMLGLAVLLALVLTSFIKRGPADAGRPSPLQVLAFFARCILVVLAFSAIFWPAWGFIVGEVVASHAPGWRPLNRETAGRGPLWVFVADEFVPGYAPPAAFAAPLYGAMIGWAVGRVLNVLTPFFLRRDKKFTTFLKSEGPGFTIFSEGQGTTVEPSE